MLLNLRDQQLKIITVYTHTHIYIILCINLRVTTYQKSITDTHTKKREEFKHNTKDSYQTTREENKRRNKNNYKTINRRAIGTYLSVIILNVNSLNTLIKRYGVAEWIQKQTHKHGVFKRFTSHLKTHTQTESERMEKGIPRKWTSEESQCSNTNIRQNRL